MKLTPIITTLINRPTTTRCICGKRVFIGSPDSRRTRHGYCTCGVTLKLEGLFKKYAQVEER